MDSQTFLSTLVHWDHTVIRALFYSYIICDHMNMENAGPAQLIPEDKRRGKIQWKLQCNCRLYQRLRSRESTDSGSKGAQVRE